MNTLKQHSNPISKWAIRVGAAGLLGGVLMCLSMGGGVACFIGIALPVGICAATLGAVVGIIIKVIFNSETGALAGRKTVFSIATILAVGVGIYTIIVVLHEHNIFNQFHHKPTSETVSQYAKPPTLESKGWTQESTGRKVSGPWLDFDPPGTRYSRMADGTIYRFFPPGVRPNSEEANPFALDLSSDRPPVD